MAQFEKHFVQDLQQDIKIRQCGTIVFNADNESNVVSVDLYNGSEAYTGGGVVAGAVICPDGATVMLTGELSGNTASITLTGDCFALPGQIGVGIQIVNDNVKTTVLKAIFNVEMVSTDEIVDPDSRITASVAQLVQDIEDAIDTFPADLSGLLAAIARSFNRNTSYSAGDYVWYYGGFYRFTADKEPGNWNPGIVEDIHLADAVAAISAQIGSTQMGTTATTLTGAIAELKGGQDDLKSAVKYIHDVVYPNGNVVISTTSPTVQANTNTYYDISTLKTGNSYRIDLTISDATHLANVRTSKTESGSGNVDLITDTFTGESWASGKEIIYTPSVDGIKYLQVQFNSTYVADEATISIVVYDYTKEQTTAITELKSVDEDLKHNIDIISPEIYLDDAYNLLPPFGYTVGKLILPTGVITDYASCVLSDYIPIDPEQEYICNYTKTASVVYGNSDLTGNLNTFERTNFCFFDANKNVITFNGDASAISKAIPENAKYIRVTLASETLYPLARLIYGNFDTQPIVRITDYHKRYDDIYADPNTGYERFKMVMFGDSITHGSLSAGDDGISYVDYANDYLHSEVINVGFGGTRMTYELSDAGLFCFYHLCECIVSDDASVWDDLDAYALTNTTYAPHLATLKAIDWSTVDAIGLMYGANDYASNTPVGTEYNETITNYDGACAYGLKKLLTKYPHLQVMILAPFDREMTAGTPSTMSDRAENTAGLIMADYADSLENVVSRFHCPLVKTGKEWGINEYTILTYAPDGTHPRANIAQKRLGWLFAQAIRNHLTPVR